MRMTGPRHGLLGVFAKPGEKGLADYPLAGVSVAEIPTSSSSGGRGRYETKIRVILSGGNNQASKGSFIFQAALSYLDRLSQNDVAIGNLVQFGAEPTHIPAHICSVFEVDTYVRNKTRSLAFPLVSLLLLDLITRILWNSVLNLDPPMN